MPRKPTDEQFDIALMWLTANEGLDGESEACRAVAEWLDLELNRREKAAAVRRVARQAGVSMRRARQVLDAAPGKQ